METKNKIYVLSFLRGLAVLLVCFCHFGYPLTIKNNNLSGLFLAFLNYGKYGVNIFFVISGFIIPLSMDKAMYSIKYYLKFLGKRAMRLHPPYLAALALTLIIVAISNKIKHVPFPESTVSIIQSCFYLHIVQNNPVFWTLQIEAEYYIFMGVYFVLLKSSPKLTICLSIPLFMFLSQTHLVSYVGLLDYLIFFLIGTIGYLIYNNENLDRLEILCITALVIFSFAFYELPAAIVALLTILFILFYKGKVNKAFDFTGEISYSLYLIHYPIGTKLLYLAIKHIAPRYYPLLFIAPFLVLIPLAALFWRFIENPFAKFSNRIKYGTNKREPQILPHIQL
ncbi:Peptidoglycan/LPS O-acetylase OafA/YrhL, contains acyltransferase and SGNH-hydrolase domains [Mucilaginibacter sp. OK268]|uniref:acyltransferase family protein n=1 Tax=Mucilaginibacter sp. OK268 TaxID=1881048 RepID=UPI00087F91B7|nr:acyltransferase [Mucilaginibacter sp. OK268]SDQ01646.1 Peptidoglycan/LPS O-acetylase OafA/YrhL, contains acyltransferase and SGNH-hydrolase domains [Mucilaginibacter sp. OK268]